MNESRHQDESRLSRPHWERSKLCQGPRDSSGSFAMIFWGFGCEEESRNFKDFDMLCIILSLFYHSIKKMFRRNLSQIPWHQRQHVKECASPGPIVPQTISNTCSKSTVGQQAGGRILRYPNIFAFQASETWNGTPFLHNIAKL